MKIKKRKTPFYSEDLKKQVVKEILENKQTISSTCEKYKIGSERSVYRWIKKFRKFVEAKKRFSFADYEKRIKRTNKRRAIRG